MNVGAVFVESAGDMLFRVLGPVEAEVDGQVVDLGHARQRCVLAALLVDANRTVSVDELLDRVWGERLPQRARNILSGYLSRLRQALGVAAEVTVVRGPAGYRLTADPMAVDLHRFRYLVAQARTSGDDVLFAEALALWRGEAFATLDTSWLAGVRAGLVAERLAAQLDCNALVLDRGRHAELLPGLAGLAAEHPMDERIAGQLMLALYRCGRQAGALAEYRRIREVLVDEVGTEPGPPLQRLQRDILAADPGLQPANAQLAVPVPRPAAPPRQLPAPPRAFTGRTDVLAELDRSLATIQISASVVVVTGTAGVGKTSVALYWAHRVPDHFPDGQLYLNLRGFDPAGTPVGAGEAVRSLLDALEVPAGRIPADVDSQAGLYRSQLTGRRMLILLDDARTADQIRPLLPGASGCLVLVTSRNQLTGLVATHQAHPIPLNLLDPFEARDMLLDRLGARRISPQPAAVDAIIARCAGLPLALAVTAARAAVRPNIPLAAVAAELESSDGLAPFLDRDPAADLRAVLSSSYRVLTPAGARLFRLMSTYPGPDLGAAAAVSLAGGQNGEVHAALAELVGACLLIETCPGRYALHDLLRVYAAELVSVAERDDARQRILDHYLHTAHTAAVALEPHRDPTSLPPVLPGVMPEVPHSPGDWFAAEYPAVVAAVHVAARAGYDQHAWGLAWSLTDVFNRNGRWHDQVACFTAAVQSAQRDGDPPRAAYARRILARALTRLGRQGEALDHLDRAAEVFKRTDDPLGQAHTHIMTSFVYESLNRPRDALRHDRLALELFRAGEHRVGEARALNNVGWRLITLGDYRQAIIHCEQAYQLCRTLGDRYDEANIADSLGLAHFHLGHHRKAIAFYLSALTLYQDVGHRVGEALCLMRLGDAHRLAGHPGLARPAWQQALAILADVGHPRADDVRRRLLDPQPAAVAF